MNEDEEALFWNSVGDKLGVAVDQPAGYALYHYENRVWVLITDIDSRKEAHELLRAYRKDAEDFGAGNIYALVEYGDDALQAPWGARR